MSTIHFPAEYKPRLINSIADAADFLSPRAQSKEGIGVEAEAFLVHSQTGAPATSDAFDSIIISYKALAGFGEFTHEIHTDENDKESVVLTGLIKGTGLHEGAEITVEPGFQPEYGGAVKSDLHEIAASLDAHLDTLSQAAHAHNHRVTMPGLHPLFAGDALPLIGKKRYALMTEQARRTSGLNGLTAMRGTTGIQYNLDTSTENWDRRYRVAFALQPFANALSGNSPYLAGIDTKNASQRSVLWFQNWDGNWARDIADTVFSQDFSLEKLTGYIAEHLRLTFLARPDTTGGTNYINVGNKTLKQLLASTPDELGFITDTDVTAMVGFAFLPVKPKPHGVIELRGADGSYQLRLAQGALAVGILYDDEALSHAETLLSSITGADYVKLTDSVARFGLSAISPKLGSVREIARELVGIAQGGLSRRRLGEQQYLKPYEDIAFRNAPTPGQALIIRANALVRQNKLEPRTAIARAFLETAVPTTKATISQPARNEQAAFTPAAAFASLNR